MRLGFTDADIAAGDSDRLIDALIVWGNEKTIRARIDEHWQAGADHVCVQAIAGEGGAMSIYSNYWRLGNRDVLPEVVAREVIPSCRAVAYADFRKNRAVPTPGRSTAQSAKTTVRHPTSDKGLNNPCIGRLAGGNGHQPDTVLSPRQLWQLPAPESNPHFCVISR